MRLGGRMIFKHGLNFNLLISLIEQTHKQFQQQAIKAVNIALTIRNWLVGYYIVEFEQKGEDRAEYGSKLLSKLAESSKHIKGFDERSFRNFRLFYKQYPQIQRHILSHFPNLSIWGSVTPKFDTHTDLVQESLGAALTASAEPRGFRQ